MLADATCNISVPTVAYRYRLDLSRNDLVRMLGILVTLGLQSSASRPPGMADGSYDPSLLLVSAFAAVPSGIGMLTGQCERNLLSDEAFRRALKFYCWHQ